jgi:hypothetical protein
VEYRKLEFSFSYDGWLLRWLLVLLLFVVVPVVVPVVVGCC